MIEESTPEIITYIIPTEIDMETTERLLSMLEIYYQESFSFMETLQE